jgi:hypothetical protein
MVGIGKVPGIFIMVGKGKKIVMVGQERAIFVLA